MQIDLANSHGAIGFENAVNRLNVAPATRILLAVSGGPDSLAMLLLANTVMPDHIAAATVDHRLRPEAADEAAFVAKLCADWNIVHRVLTPKHPITGNLQSAARIARYALLEQAADELDCELIATAHHGDDQLETLLMRLARGSGVDGLAGIRARNGRIIRPMLSFSKAELEQICTDAGVKPVRDPGNEDANFDRIAMRHYLSGRPNPFDARRAVRTGSSIADAVAAMCWMTEQLSGTRIGSENGTITVDMSGLPRELQRRLLLVCLGKIDSNIKPRGDAIERLLDDLTDGNTATIGDILCRGGSVWRFSSAPPRRTG